MPKVQLTKAEAELVRQNRKRLQLDNHDWSSEPFIGDRDLFEMSPHVAGLFRLSNTWVRDEKTLGCRNIAHPDNTSWYMEYLMGQMSLGLLAPEDVHEKLTNLPAYTKSGG